MRLLITTDTAGGVWSFGLQLASGLLAGGDSVALAGFGPPATAAQKADCETLREQWSDRFAFVDTAIPLEWMQHNEYCFEQGVQTLRRAAHTFNADLLHSNQFCYGAVQLGIPKVVTAHSDVFSWARGCGRTLEPSAWLDRYRELVQAGLSGADALTAPTAWMLLALEEEFKLPALSAVIANGHAASALTTRRRQLSAVTAGRLWDPGKGLDILRDLDSPMPIAVAGEQRCEDAVADVPPGVELQGVLQQDELLQLFSESAIYLCASRYEPFGLAALEAALCGCAVVARDIPSLREVWGEAAAYFAGAEELSALLKRLYRDPEYLREVQSRAGERARLYTRERMVNGYRELYSGVMAQERVRVA